MTKEEIKKIILDETKTAKEVTEAILSYSPIFKHIRQKNFSNPQQEIYTEEQKMFI